VYKSVYDSVCICVFIETIALLVLRVVLLDSSIKSEVQFVWAIANAVMGICGYVPVILQS
jgi:hypothetical protein